MTEDQAKNLSEHNLTVREDFVRWLGTAAEAAALKYPEKSHDFVIHALEKSEDHTAEGWFGKGCQDAEEVFKKLSSGWPEGRQDAFDALDALRVPKIANGRRKRRRGRAGDEVDMQRVWRGDLDRAWQYRSRDAAGPRAGAERVTVLVKTDASASTDARQMFWPGAAAMRIADALESAGRSVRIVGTMAVKLGRPRVRTAISLVAKNHGEVLDLDRVAAVTALAGTMRTCGFNIAASLSNYFGKYPTGGLAVPTAFDSFSDEELDPESPTIIRIPELRTARDASQFLQKMESELG